ncbi:MAG: hypothetical protein EOO27_46360 [Comamonadaceae bacterium]|nr:MAG: hypothetical protein EOO27_46360 [Comamonadaceae bacterium]
MTDHLRSLSVHVDEHDPGVFHWIILESTEDASVWGEQSASEESFDRWDEAFAAGFVQLRLLADDQARGPRTAGEDEDADPVG